MPQGYFSITQCNCNRQNNYLKTTLCFRKSFLNWNIFNMTIILLISLIDGNTSIVEKKPFPLSSLEQWTDVIHDHRTNYRKIPHGIRLSKCTGINSYQITISFFSLVNFIYQASTVVAIRLFYPLFFCFFFVPGSKVCLTIYCWSKTVWCRFL